MGKYFFLKTLLLSFSNERMHDIDTRWFSGEISSTSFDAGFFFPDPSINNKDNFMVKKFDLSLTFLNSNKKPKQNNRQRLSKAYRLIMNSIKR